MLNATSARRSLPHLSTNDGTLFRPDSRGGAYDYEVDLRCRPERSPAARVSAGRCRQAAAVDPRGPPAPAARNRRAASSRTSTPRASEGIAARARKLEAFLRDSGQFSYTLQMDVMDRSARPGRRLPGQPQGGTLRILRQRTGAVAAVDRHPVPHGQRLQGGRLERADRKP